MAEASLNLLERLHGNYHRQGEDWSGRGLARGCFLCASHYLMMASAGLEYGASRDGSCESNVGEAVA